MYNNIGGKIKFLAKFIFITLTIAEEIAGIVFLAIDNDLQVYGLLIMILGPIVTWLSSWLIYGFGELIDKICEIERNTRSGEKKSKTQSEVDAIRISKIEKLRAQGLITEEEYQKAVSKEQ